MSSPFAEVQTPRSMAPVTSTTSPAPYTASHGRWSVRTRLMGIVLVAAVLAAIVGLAGLYGVSKVNSARGADLLVTDVQTDLARVDAARSDMGAAVNEAVVAHDPNAHIAASDPQIEFAQAADAVRRNFTSAVSRGMRGKLEADLWAQWPQLARFIDAGQSIMAIAGSDPSAAAGKLNGFDVATEQSLASVSRFDRRLAQASLTAERTASDATTSARYEIFAIGAAAILLLFALAWGLGRSIVRALRGVGVTAVAITSGDLDARTTIVGDDEIGALGRALNRMADSLRELFAQLGDEARRDAFRTQLSEAFEIADTVPVAYTQVEFAMREVSDELPMELLLADSSRANMTQKAIHPTIGAPGCPVRTPYDCMAVRRGSAVVFDSSEALNACPKLRDRLGGPCSAACFPVTFMGRALGVLHTTGPESAPPSAQEVLQLGALAAQAGSTIGTVRSTESTVREATTDGLTGLANRRTLENEMRALMQSGREFAVAMADLDHFKVINDTFGHEAGDRALRLYAQVARAHVRNDDVIGRYGGEEFVLLFPGQSVVTARETLERLRAELASAHTDGRSPRVTASYGIADSRSGSTMDEVLRVADLALAEAKRSGRDRIVVSGEPAPPADAEVGERGASAPNPS